MAETVPTTTDLPTALVSTDQWVCWRTQERDGTETKVPIDPHTGGFGSATDPATWATFETAREHATDGAVDGVGFVFTADDPFAGVDLDDCRVPETGSLAGDATDIVETLASYTEVSPSGTGVHVLVEGTVPGDRNRSGDVELYDTARFFTVTGDHVEGTPVTIERRQAEIRAVHAEFVRGNGPTGSPAATSDGESTSGESDGVTGVDEPDVETTPGEGDAATATAPATASTQDPDGAALSDEALLERARNAANGAKFRRLWRGDTSGYDSHSEADMALCSLLAFWTAGDPDRVDRLFRRSGLLREKWDERHYGDGSSYGEKTVQRAIATVDDHYDPSSAAETRTGGSSSTADADDGRRRSAAGSSGSAGGPGGANGESSRPSRVGSADPGTESAAPSVSALTARIETLELEVRRLRSELERERERRTDLERRLDEGDLDDGDDAMTSDDEIGSRSVWRRAAGLLGSDADRPDS